MTVNETTAAASSSMNQTLPNKNDLGKDEFLKILAAQFQNQNPLEPVKDTEFIAQMAQFSSLEQLQNISLRLDSLQGDLLWNQAVSLLGVEVQAVSVEDEILNGVASKIRQEDGQIFLTVDDQEITLEQIIVVSYREPEPVAVSVETAASPSADQGIEADE